MIKARRGIKEYQSFMRLAGIRDIYEIEAIKFRDKWSNKLY
jgi:hypothetical protein